MVLDIANNAKPFHFKTYFAEKTGLSEFRVDTLTVCDCSADAVAFKCINIYFFYLCFLIYSQLVIDLPGRWKRFLYGCHLC